MQTILGLKYDCDNIVGVARRWFQRPESKNTE